MNKKEIPYQQTSYFSNTVLDYLNDKNELKPFYNEYCDIDSFKKAIEKRKQHKVDRQILVQVLEQQYKDVEISEQVKSNIQLLNNETCFTVTTGHQLNLFTGHLYFIYKIITTINLAKELSKKYTDYKFVPIYWMASEDHDFEEVSFFNLFDKRYQLEQKQKGAVGEMNLEGIDELYTELAKDLGTRENADEVLTILKKFYNKSSSFAQATRGFVNYLFEKYGLVIIDGNDKQLKKQAIPVFEKELLEQSNHQLINSSSDQLVNLGYKKQVNPREINLFYMINGVRERIIFDNEKFSVLNHGVEFSKNEIIKELHDSPERFSPNVVLRPLFQEIILPNLAYVGGGAELTYWLQLKEMFEKNNVFYPILLLRNSALVIDKNSAQKIQKLGLEEADLFKDTELLIKNYLTQIATIVLNLQKEEQEVINIFDDIVKKAGSIDQSLQPFVKAELQKSIKSLKNIENRLIKAEKKKEEIVVNQLMNLKVKLFPNNGLQERTDNFLQLYLLHGSEIIEELINDLDPFAKKFSVLS